MRVPIDESNRLIFIKRRTNGFAFVNRWLGVALAHLCVFLVMASAFIVYANMRYKEGVADGTKAALEIACVKIPR